jgi:signal transduction histidine kinase
MRPLFSNLIGNAIKYRKKDVDPIINIYADQEKEAVAGELIDAGNRKFCRIYVEDNGIGFTTTHSRNGVGITNILNRVETYNGSVNIFSSPGKGCRLEVTIPLK